MAELSAEQIAVRERLWREAMKTDQTVYSDEDEVIFTRVELRVLWGTVFADASNAQKMRETLQEWLDLGNLPGGGYNGNLEERTKELIAS